MAMRRGWKIAKAALARKLAVELYWRWRRGWDYEQMQQPGRSGCRSVLENILTPATLLETAIFHHPSFRGPPSVPAFIDLPLVPA
jgi:hypothetical protein